MGNPRIRTPNIDQLAKEGIRFTQALAAAPVCAPLRIDDRQTHGACFRAGQRRRHAAARRGSDDRLDAVRLPR